MIITWLLYRRPENLSKATKPMVDQLLLLLDLAEPSTLNSRKDKAARMLGQMDRDRARYHGTGQCLKRTKI